MKHKETGTGRYMLVFKPNMNINFSTETQIYLQIPNGTRFPLCSENTKITMPSYLKLCFQHQQKRSFSPGSHNNLTTEFIQVQLTKFHFYITL